MAIEDYISNASPQIIGTILGQGISFIVAYNFFQWRIRHERNSKIEDRKKIKADLFTVIYGEITWNLWRLQDISQMSFAPNTAINELLNVNSKNTIWAAALTYISESTDALLMISNLYDDFDLLNRHIDRTMFSDPNHRFPFHLIDRIIDECEFVKSSLGEMLEYIPPEKFRTKAWRWLNGFDAPA